MKIYLTAEMELETKDQGFFNNFQLGRFINETATDEEKARIFEVFRSKITLSNFRVGTERSYDKGYENGKE